jgi:DNA helicase-2/ATP-dependent DNA helicase PcrA
MVELDTHIGVGNAAIVAPAGHGKTEAIAKAAAQGRRTLILTHTHAGVHAIRSRLKRLEIPHARVSVDTIAGWCIRYAHAFPKHAEPPPDMPQNGDEWNQLYRGTRSILDIGPIREVIDASYDRILIDEYQDCGNLQHELALALSSIVPTVIFGDPMQGIFEFAEANLNWDYTIHPHFPLVVRLETPHRWADKNPELGRWIAETREKLIQGEVIDLESGPITYRCAEDAFDMNAFFDGLDSKEGSFAAIHCNKRLCYRLAKSTRGAYQAIEEIAANRLREFARTWDQASDPDERFIAFTHLLDDCFHKNDIEPNEPENQADIDLIEEINAAANRLATDDNGAEAARSLVTLSRKYSRWRLFRNELWRDAERALSEVATGRSTSMYDAVSKVRQRLSLTGRQLPKRTVSTPLLLKGLEFDHVLVPDATHFINEQKAQAKLFYVAISRATRSLTITSSQRYLQFPIPML